MHSYPTARRAWAFCFAFLLGSACSAPPAAAPPAPQAQPLHRGPITDFVPAAGLRWMVMGSPRRITADSTLHDAVSVLLPPDRVEAFARGTGVDIRHVESALAAGFDLGTLYVWTPAPETNPSIAARFRERIVSGERISRPHPAIERITGLVGTTPEGLLQVADDIDAVAVGDIVLIRVVEAFARDRLPSSPPALRGAALATLAPVRASSVATFYAPGPFAGEWAHGARGLLANALALSVSLTPSAPGRARIELQLAGDFSATGVDELRLAFDDLAHSPIGKLLALDQGGEPPKVRQEEQRLYLEIEVDLAPIARGLRAAVVADVWEIMGTKRPE